MLASSQRSWRSSAVCVSSVQSCLWTRYAIFLILPVLCDLSMFLPVWLTFNFVLSRTIQKSKTSWPSRKGSHVSVWPTSMTSVKAKTFVRVERRWTTSLEWSSRRQRKTSPKRRYRTDRYLIAQMLSFAFKAHCGRFHACLKTDFYPCISRVMEAVADTSHVSVALAWSCMPNGSMWMKTLRRRRFSSALNVCMRSSNAFQMKRTWSWAWTPNTPVLSGWLSQCCLCPLLLWDQLWSCRALLETRLVFLIEQWERSLMYWRGLYWWLSDILIVHSSFPPRMI